MKSKERNRGQRHDANAMSHDSTTESPEEVPATSKEEREKKHPLDAMYYSLIAKDLEGTRLAFKEIADILRKNSTGETREPSRDDFISDEKWEEFLSGVENATTDINAESIVTLEDEIDDAKSTISVSVDMLGKSLSVNYFLNTSDPPKVGRERLGNAREFIENARVSALDKISASLEKESGERIPVAIFPRRLRESLRIFIESCGSRLLYSESGENEIDEFMRYKALMTPRELSFGGEVYYIPEEELIEIKEILKAFDASDYDIGRCSSFSDFPSMVSGLKNSSKDGGATGSVTENGSNFDDGNWAKKTIFNFRSPQSGKRALIFLHNGEELVRTDDADEAWLDYYGFKPKAGKEFVDSLRGVIVLD